MSQNSGGSRSILVRGQSSDCFKLVLISFLGVAAVCYDIFDIMNNNIYSCFQKSCDRKIQYQGLFMKIVYYTSILLYFSCGIMATSNLDAFQGGEVYKEYHAFSMVSVHLDM